jgi:large subunit ribosomal protein L24
MQKIKKGDTVLVIAGKDITERGEVLEVLPKKDRVKVQGINIVKKHEKARQAGNRQVPAQIVEAENYIHVSNVKVVCPSCDQATRVGIRVNEEGKKVRFCKKCNAEIE